MCQNSGYLLRTKPLGSERLFYGRCDTRAAQTNFAPHAVNNWALGRGIYASNGDFCKRQMNMEPEASNVHDQGSTSATVQYQEIDAECVESMSEDSINDQHSVLWHGKYSLTDQVDVKSRQNKVRATLQSQFDHTTWLLSSLLQVRSLLKEHCCMGLTWPSQMLHSHKTCSSLPWEARTANMNWGLAAGLANFRTCIIEKIMQRSRSLFGEIYCLLEDPG